MATAESRPHPTNLWTDVSLQRLPSDVRRMLDYLMTGPDVSAAGVTQVEDGVIAARVGFHQLTVDKTIQILADQGEVYVDWETREAWPVRWARFHKFEKQIARRALERAMQGIRSPTLKRLISPKMQLKQGHSGQQQRQHQRQQQEEGGEPPPPAELPTATPSNWLTSETHPITASTLMTLVARAAARNPKTRSADDTAHVRCALRAAHRLNVGDATAAQAVELCEWPSQAEAAIKAADEAERAETNAKRFAAQTMWRPAGESADALALVGKTVTTLDGALIQIGRAGAKIAGKIKPLGELTIMVAQGNLQVVDNA